MSIAESPRSAAQAQGWDGLPASFGILSAAAAGVQHQDALGALGPTPTASPASLSAAADRQQQSRAA